MDSESTEKKEVGFQLRFAILVLPLLFSWATLRKGHSTKSRVISFAWLGLVLLIGFTGEETTGATMGIIIIGGFFFTIWEFALFMSSLVKKRLAEQQGKSVKEAKQTPNETLTPRREKALYKLATQILEDDVVDLDESKKLRAWFKRYPESKDDHRTKELAEKVELYLEDKVLDKDEALALFALLTDFCDGFESREQSDQKQKKPAPKLRKQINVESSSDLSFLNELELGVQYYMNYKDAAGNISDREIVLRNIENIGNGDIYIKAFCLMRNSIRTFRADRITSMCSVETGEALV